MSNLTIVAHPWNQNVEIQCAFRTLESTTGIVDCSSELVTCSKRVVLKIQGIKNYTSTCTRIIVQT